MGARESHPIPDYSKLSGPELLYALGTDPYKWADAFMQYSLKTGGSVDHATMVAWFANAISAYEMASGAVYNGDHAQWLLDREDDSD